MRESLNEPKINGESTNNVKSSKASRSVTSARRRNRKTDKKKYTRNELNKMDFATLKIIAKKNKVMGAQRRTIVPNLLKLWK